MAPPRRTRSTNKSQSTLSFRATKASAAAPATKDTLSPTLPPPKKARLSDTSVGPDADSTPAPPSPASLDLEPAPKAVSLETPLDQALPTTAADDDEEEDEEPDAALAAEYAAARSLPAARITSYWTAKERLRRAPRVHQASLSTNEKVLREFDVSSRYGPSIGITREARWVRAWRLGLAPPVEVLGVLLGESEGKNKGKKGKTEAMGERLQVSIIDELMGSTARGDRGTGLEV